MNPLASDSPSYLLSGPEDAPLRLALAHGAGVPMDSPFLEAAACGLGNRGWRVIRFEFPYMARRRQDGRKRSPDRLERLQRTWRTVIADWGPQGLVIGGKSLGGRVASLVADEAGTTGLVVLGYPFHPPGKPEKTRIEPLRDLASPALFVQGERDPFGSREEVAQYALSPTIRFHWAEDGDHDLIPRKRSGHTTEANWEAAQDAVDSFLQELVGP